MPKYLLSKQLLFCSFMLFIIPVCLFGGETYSINKPSLRLKEAYQRVQNNNTLNTATNSIFPSITYHEKALRDTFYIDPENATVSGNGKSPNSPLRSFPESLWGKPGTTILYKRGITVRGKFPVFSGTSSAPVIIGAYGEGAKPIFMKSIDLDNEKYWIQESPNIWKCVKDLDKTTGANIIYNNEEYCGTMRWEKKDLKNQGDWYMIDTLGGTLNFKDILYVYSKQNPGKVYSAIEYVPSEHFYKLLAKDSCIIVQDIHIKNAGKHGFQIEGSYNITIRRCDLSYIGGAAFPNIGKNGLWVRYGNAIEIWNRGRNIYVEDCQIYENYDAGFVAQGSLGAGSIDSVVVRNNVFWNNGFDNFDNSWGEEITRVYFENNTCIDAGDGWAYETEGRPRLSEFLPDVIGWAVFLDSFALDRSSIFIRNNIFYNATGNSLVRVNKLPENGWPNIHLSNNCYFQKNPDDVLVQVEDKIYKTNDFKQYQLDTGKDQHSIVADPLFIDPQGRDYRLRANSPCRNAGVQTGIRNAANDWPVDIGAYQFPLIMK